MEVPFVFDNDPSSRVLQAKLIQQQAKERLMKAEEEARIAEQEALIAEEQARIADEEAKLAEIKRIEEENRIAEEARLNEIKRIEEENRIAEEIHINEIKRIEEENKIAEEARINEIKRKEEEAWILIKEDFSELSKIAKEKRMTYEKEFDDDFDDRLEEIEDNIKLVDNSKEYMSNILLKFTSGLCKKIHTTETPVNPILKELSGFVVEYYQEQKDLPEILNPRKKLKDIQKEISNFIENHTKLQNDIQIYKSDIYIKEKYLQDLERTKIELKKYLDIKQTLVQNIEQYDSSIKYYISHGKNNDKKFIIKSEEELKINESMEMEIFKKLIKYEYDDLRQKCSIEHKELQKKSVQIRHNLKHYEGQFIQNECQFIQNEKNIIKSEEKLKENEKRIQQLLIKKQEIENNLKEFYDFEFKLRPNISFINFDEYIIYITEKYNLEKDIHQKWSLDLIKKLEPHRKKIVDLQKLFT